jgi:hypothetical protein
MKKKDKSKNETTDNTKYKKRRTKAITRQDQTREERKQEIWFPQMPTMFLLFITILFWHSLYFEVILLVWCLGKSYVCINVFICDEFAVAFLTRIFHKKASTNTKSDASLNLSTWCFYARLFHKKAFFYQTWPWGGEHHPWRGVALRREVLCPLIEASLSFSPCKHATPVEQLQDQIKTAATRQDQTRQSKDKLQSQDKFKTNSRPAQYKFKSKRRQDETTQHTQHNTTQKQNPENKNQNQN